MLLKKEAKLRSERPRESGRSHSSTFMASTSLLHWLRGACGSRFTAFCRPRLDST